MCVHGCAALKRNDFARFFIGAPLLSLVAWCFIAFWCFDCVSITKTHCETLVIVNTLYEQVYSETHASLQISLERVHRCASLHCNQMCAIMLTPQLVPSCYLLIYRQSYRNVVIKNIKNHLLLSNLY